MKLLQSKPPCYYTGATLRRDSRLDLETTDRAIQNR